MKKKIYLQRLSKNIVFADVNSIKELKSRLTNTIFVINRRGEVFKYSKEGKLEPINLNDFAINKGYKTVAQYLREVEKTSLRKVSQTIIKFNQNRANAPQKLSRYQKRMKSFYATENSRRQSNRKLTQDFVNPPF